MALKQNNAEGSVTGTIIATGQTGSGDSFNSVSPVGAPTYIYTNTQSMHGTQSYRVSGTSSDRLYIDFTGGSVTASAARVYMRFVSLPSAATDFIQIRNTVGGLNAGIGMNTSGRLQVKDTGSTLYTFPGSVSLNTWYRLELQTTVSTTAGMIGVSYFLGDNASPVEAAFSTSTANTSANNASYFRFGKPTQSTATDVFYDDVAWNYGDATPIGPYVVPTNQVPIANAGVNQTDLEPYTVITLTGSDSDSDGTIASRSWTQVSGSPSVMLASPSAAITTYVAPGTIAGTTLTFGYTVTDNGGASSAQSTVQHIVLPVTERAVMSGAEVPVSTKAVSGGTLI